MADPLFILGAPERPKNGVTVEENHVEKFLRVPL